MRIKDWKLHYAVGIDMKICHRELGALADFFVTSKPGHVIHFTSGCVVQGQVYGHETIPDGTTITTGPVSKISRVPRESKYDCEYLIYTSDGEYYTSERFVNQKFFGEAWTCGTPGVH